MELWEHGRKKIQIQQEKLANDVKQIVIAMEKLIVSRNESKNKKKCCHWCGTEAYLADKSTHKKIWKIFFVTKYGLKKACLTVKSKVQEKSGRTI